MISIARWGGWNNSSNKQTTSEVSYSNDAYPLAICWKRELGSLLPALNPPPHPIWTLRRRVPLLVLRMGAGCRCKISPLPSTKGSVAKSESSVSTSIVFCSSTLTLPITCARWSRVPLFPDVSVRNSAGPSPWCPRGACRPTFRTKFRT